MNLNADFDQRVVVRSDAEPWQPSPMQGVDRRMLDRIGGEVARATTIVRYAKGSSFSAHTHTGGEEFLVLEGTFQDEHGDYPTGTYVRNPPTSSHVPRSENGCTIFVKLWQFDLVDRTQTRIDTSVADFAPLPGAAGISSLPLHQDNREKVTMEKWAPDTGVTRDLPKGAELLVIHGTISEGGEELEQNTWLRLPMGSQLSARSGSDGATLWVKTGHLPFAQAPEVSA